MAASRNDYFESVGPFESTENHKVPQMGDVVRVKFPNRYASLSELFALRDWNDKHPLDLGSEPVTVRLVKAVTQPAE